MKLYSNVERVWNEVNQLQLETQHETLSAEKLNKFDMYNYLAHSSLDTFISKCGITSESSVLDVGSGIGGPARYIADKTGATVIGVDIQKDCVDAANELTLRCGALSENVEFLVGDFCDGSDPSISLLNNKRKKRGQSCKFDILTSYLVFLHIPLSKRPTLFSSCFSSLCAGGVMQIEDYVKVNPFSFAERQSLLRDVYCPDLPTKEQYRAALEEAGFVEVEFQSMTSPWNDFVHLRLEEYKKQRERHVHVHGEATVKALTHFYQKVADLFAGENLGGVRILARRP